MNKFDKNDIRERVRHALDAFYANDSALITIEANERSITHKFAEHLQKEFPDWKVDCEYNRDGSVPKRLSKVAAKLEKEPIKAGDNKGKTVYPDIIVHKRKDERKTKNNLLVIEAKKSTGGIDAIDKEKLEAFTLALSGQGLNYRFGLWINFKKTYAATVKDIDKHWFVKGKETAFKEIDK